MWMAGEGVVLLRLQIRGRVVQPYEKVRVTRGEEHAYGFHMRHVVFVPKFRTSAALVLSVHRLDGTKIKDADVRRLYSSHERSFTYHVGKVARPEHPLDTDPEHACGSGIHFFKHRCHTAGYAI